MSIAGCVSRVKFFNQRLLWYYTFYMQRPKPLILIILDGFGISEDAAGNPIREAHTPNLETIEKYFPFTTLQASGTAVGLPWGEAGNSEVGHLTIGAGRVIYHHLPRIINAIYDDSFFKNKAFLAAARHVKKHASSFHIAGLVSSGSVHSYIDHLYALFDFTKKESVERVFLHVFTDGKDAPPNEGAKFLMMLDERLKKQWPHVRLASIIGRFYALDRDEKWERTRAAYELLTEGKGGEITSVPEYLQKSYQKGITDEFIEPAIVKSQITSSIQSGAKSQISIVQQNDALVFSDFREDSMRQITRAFAVDSFDAFPRTQIPNLFVVTMTEYDEALEGVEAAFPKIEVRWPLARVIAEEGLTQLRVAETQKYAHVTYFFNGGREKAYEKEERILIPSLPAHPDEAPHMRAREITAKIIDNFSKYDVIIANFANADLVGHSGDFRSATQAVDILDEEIGEIMNVVLNSENAVMIITGDHGNIELKRNVISGEERTEHSINPVPLYLIGNQFRKKAPRTNVQTQKQKKEAAGVLTDVAPTIIELLGLKKPHEMTGESLLSVLLKRET